MGADHLNRTGRAGSALTGGYYSNIKLRNIRFKLLFEQGFR